MGIKLDRIQPGCPYQNGSHERMHLDMKKELEGQIDGDMRYHQKIFEKWRREYNDERPHETLKMKTPSSIYKESKISYEPGIVEFEYPRTFKNRNVNSRGYVNYKAKRFFLGNPFNGYNVGLEIDKEGEIHVWFGNTRLGHFDQETLLLIPEENANFKTRKKRKVLPMS